MKTFNYLVELIVVLLLENFSYCPPRASPGGPREVMATYLDNHKDTQSKKVHRGCFVHLDLGIGGAEQLITHAARGLKTSSYDVEIYTTFFDPGRCFSGLKLDDRSALARRT